MINWKLAEKLKNAGFPQKYKQGDWFYRCGKICEDQHFVGELEYADDGGADTYEATEDSVKIPTLSELIAACGVKYLEKEKEYEFSLFFSTDEWFATYSDEEYGAPKLENGQGKSPEEAVSLLWMELNKK